jgi:ParB/RepB/Spo0J family partition protein
MTSHTVTHISTSQIVAGNNDRTTFDPKALAELAASIQANGLIQPITVRSIEGTELYQIVAGERRFRAMDGVLGWQTVPAIVADLTDEEAAAVMLSENVSRQDIDPIDEANAYASRMKAYGWTVARCAEAAGVSEIRVQFRVKLLALRPDVQALVKTGNLQLGYAQVLASAGLDSTRQIMALAALRDHTNPTPAWFRRLCSDLLSQQAQETMLDAPPIFGGDLEAPATRTSIVEPPHPSTTTPPVAGRSAKDKLSSQAAFWTDAAAQWERLGRPFKRQEFQAAAQALQTALALL